MSRTLFDLAEAEALKERGIALAVTKRAVTLEYARGIARTIARVYGECTADDVQHALLNDNAELLGNAAGGLFRGAEWEFTGQWRKSERVSNHGHLNRIWRLKNG